jgi:BirA family transcriptional regulator, biotin operon repressor / biotin---[acetyl-CoA-carboxylase] ligase
MTQPREEWHLDTRRLGRRVYVYERTDSTNDRAAELAGDPAHDGVAVLADEQTAGRGQYGRTWLAAPRESVLLSVLLLPPPPLRRPAVLTAWAAVSVCTLVHEAVGLPARIKWPNDVLLRDRKVCGILIEQAAGTVVGIGLNVRQSAAQFARAGLPLATSLAQFTATPLDTHALAKQLLRRLDEGYDRLCRGELATLEAGWKVHLGLLGKQVAAECRDGIHQGRLRELTFDAVELERPGAPPLVLPPERVQHLEPA